MPTKLQLHLENCDTIEFDWEHVHGISINDITHSTNITTSGIKVSSLYCSSFFIELKKGAKGQYVFDNGGAIWKKRVALADITSISVLYEDGQKDHWRVQWPVESDGYTHPHQGIMKDWRGGWLIYCCERTKGAQNGS